MTGSELKKGEAKSVEEVGVAELDGLARSSDDFGVEP